MSLPAPSPPLAPWNVVECLSELPGFSDLSTTCLDTLVDSGTACVLASGQTLLSQGQETDAIYILLFGRAKMVRSLENGRQLVLALLHPGDIFGTTAALGRRPCDASVVTLQEGSCLRLDRAQLFGLLRRRSDLIEELLPLLTRPLAECRNCTVELSCLRVEERFAKLLLKLADNVGRRAPGGIFIPVRLSRQELADMTGTTIETCIRIMSRWGKKTWVITGKQGFVLVNRAALENLAAG